MSALRRKSSSRMTLTGSVPRTTGTANARGWAVAKSLAMGRFMLVFAALGCARRPEKLERYLPTPATARAATAAALDAWTAGRPVGPLGTAAAPIQVVATHRPPGRRPARYEILASTPREGSRLVTARLTLADPEESIVVRYHGFGLKPLWVVRHEDLEMLGHWDHNRTETPQPAAPARGEAPG